MNLTANGGKNQPGVGQIFLPIAVLIFLMVMGLIFYTFAHEGGHALLGLVFGGRITDFSINFLDLSAHVGLDGDFTTAKHALISVAGVSFPLTISLALLFLTSKNREFVFFSFKSIFFLISVSSLLAWVIIPILALLGNPVGDDSFNFLNYTRIHPLLESAAALVIFIAGWMVFFKKMGGVRPWVDRYRTSGLDLVAPAARRSIVALAVSGAVILGSAYALDNVFSDATFLAPEGAEPVAVLDLSQGGYSNQSVYSFQLEQPTTLGMTFLLFDITGGPIRIHMLGSDGFDAMYLNISDPEAEIGQAKVNPPLAVLEPGEYEIRVTLPACEGRVEVYRSLGSGE